MPATNTGWGLDSMNTRYPASCAAAYRLLELHGSPDALVPVVGVQSASVNGLARYRGKERDRAGSGLDAGQRFGEGLAYRIHLHRM